MQLEDLNIILKVAEFRSITAAAESLDMRTATASAAVKRVERSLGVELFIRTTRQLRLSAAGEKYIPNCEQALQMLQHAQQNVKDDLDIIDGELRISVPSDLGRNLILPWLDEFMQLHPGVRLKLHISDSNIDFYRDPIDVALRYGFPNDASLYGFKICNVPRVICAAPEYIDKYGLPKHPNDLASHNGLLYQLHDIVHDVWKFSNQGQSIKVKVQGNRTSNDAELVRRWCVNGKGIAAKSCLDMAPNLLTKQVIPLLSEFTAKPTELWLICPSRQAITPAVRLLREHIKEKCADIITSLIEQGILEQ
ncbi:LysR family transcriptional regulator [Paraglaciecola arctica]|uniref:LysR family transcriptional regulator n=1 Tax=Paraglaciecola arctica TaxID=1128911 RepID=UPI001C06E40D|nr:LysR family transcriptional regulator [Paraglaciecola arctica]MBU3005452.1 LysR family transcriptional regulator [Paraglaciecola arctica]